MKDLCLLADHKIHVYYKVFHVLSRGNHEYFQIRYVLVIF